MAWTTLLNAVFAIDKPAIGAHMIALRDNITAVMQGLSDAPRLRIGALQRIAAGESIRLSDPAGPAQTGAGSNDYVPISFAQVGTCRVKVTYSFSGSGNGRVEISRRRGGAFATLGVAPNVTGGGNPKFILDIDVLPGDSLYITAVVVSPSTGTASADLIEVCTNGEDLFPGSYAALVNNTYT